MKVQLVLILLDEHYYCFFSCFSYGKNQSVFIFVEFRSCLHDCIQRFDVILYQCLFKFIEFVRQQFVGQPLRNLAKQQKFSHLSYYKLIFINDFHEMSRIQAFLFMFTQLLEIKDEQQYRKMGNFNSKQEELEYHSEYESPIYGKGTLFSSTKLPNCYIIKTLKLINDETIFKLYSQIENHQNIYLLSLYGYLFGKSCECDQDSIMKKCVITYWQFLSFSLKDCISYRKRISVPFHENEIWHIIKAAISGYLTFQRVNVYYDFQEDLLLLNHQGRIRLSWQHILSRNEHIKYYKIQKQFRRYLDQQRSQESSETRGTSISNDNSNTYRNLLWMKILNQSIYYSPEELHSIVNFEFTHKINFTQSNIFSLGMMLLHVCTLSQPLEVFYSYFAVDYNRINFVMATQLSKVYSHNLLVLIGQMLNENPYNRITAQAIRQIYGPFMRGQFEINMAANRDFKKSIKSKHFT